ncbi:MAG: hypothetical protein U0359_36840 [Byssovorax sp.]
MSLLGEPCTYRLIALDGAAVPPDQISSQDLAELAADLEHLGVREPLSLDSLLDVLYTASSHSDPSRMAPALDRMLEYVEHWSTVTPEQIATLFERLDPSRLVRAVGQTLLAATRLACHASAARQTFVSRFFADLRARGTPEPTVRRLEEGLRA